MLALLLSVVTINVFLYYDEHSSQLLIFLSFIDSEYVVMAFKHSETLCKI